MLNPDYMEKSELTPIVDTWLTRKVLAEDVEYLKKKGGLQWIVNGLCTDIETGIDPNSVETRRVMYGTGVIEVQEPKCNPTHKSLFNNK
jgi:hypothetical protein